jgi:hypothetical protein
MMGATKQILLIALFALMGCGKDTTKDVIKTNTIVKHGLYNINSYEKDGNVYMYAKPSQWSEYHAPYGYEVTLPDAIVVNDARIRQGDVVTFYYYVDQCDFIYRGNAFIRQCNNPVIFVESCANFIIGNDRGYNVTLTATSYREY